MSTPRTPGPSSSQTELRSRRGPVELEPVSSFSIQKLAPRKIRANEEFEYELRITNTGADVLEGAVLVEALLSSVSIRDCYPASQIPEPHMARWTLGRIEPGETRRVRIRACSERDMTFRSHSSLSFSTHG